MEDQEKYIQALIELHQGLERQGPGDAAYTRFILSQLPELPANPRIADIGCGAGAGALILADHFQSTVRAVDFSRQFLDELQGRARQRGLAHLIETIECDMGKLDWAPESIDLLWSEGAAYNITFEGALNAWRPLMAPNGIAVLSEMNYFTVDPPEPIKNYLLGLYPGIKTEPQNADLINASGFELSARHRLPTRAWWDNYYNPLRSKVETLKSSKDSVIQAVIRDTEEEMKYFEEYADDYGYSFYIMRAV